MVFGVFVKILLMIIFFFVYECDSIILVRGIMKILFIRDEKLYYSISKYKYEEGRKKRKDKCNILDRKI